MKAPRYRTLVATADQLVKTGGGTLHSITLSSDAAATAGTLIIRDGVDASGTPIIDTITFVAAFMESRTLIYDVEFNTGLFLDFTTTADVQAQVSFK